MYLFVILLLYMQYINLHIAMHGMLDKNSHSCLNMSGIGALSPELSIQVAGRRKEVGRAMWQGRRNNE